MGDKTSPAARRNSELAREGSVTGQTPKPPDEGRATKALSYGKLSSDDQKYSFFIDESCKLQSSKDYGKQREVSSPALQLDRGVQEESKSPSRGPQCLAMLIPRQQPTLCGDGEK